MASTIQLKRGSGAPTAGDLAVGEPALDLTNKRLYTEDTGGTVVEVGTNPAAEITANAGIALPDNQKATFGASDDLQIYHDGSASYIDDVGTGDLIIRGAQVVITDASGSKFFEAKNNDQAVIYANGSQKLTTTATGVDITGNAGVTSLVEGIYSLTGTAINPSSGSIQYKTLAANTTFTATFLDGQSVVLRLAGGSTYTVTWPTITWVSATGNSAPTLTASDVVVLWQESSTLYGAYVGSYV